MEVVTPEKLNPSQMYKIQYFETEALFQTSHSISKYPPNTVLAKGSEHI
jgi:hypothetical protein